MSKLDDDVPLIATFLFLVYWVALYRYLENLSQSIIWATVITSVSVVVYKIIRYIWQK